MNGWSKDRLAVSAGMAAVIPAFANQIELAMEDEKRETQDRIMAQIGQLKTKAVRLQAGAKWMGQRVEFLTQLFGVEYYWMRDIENTVYLARVGKDGNPELL